LCLAEKGAGVEGAVLTEYAGLWTGEPRGGTYGGDHCWFVVLRI